MTWKVYYTMLQRKNEAMNQGMALMGTLDAAKKAYSQDGILGGVTGL
jgi:hypothetical protein